MMLRIRSRLYLIYLIVILIFTTTFHKSISNLYKDKCLTTIGIKASSNNKYAISNIFYRYAKFINSDTDINAFYRKFWSIKYGRNEFDPYNPGSGWGSRVHKLVYPLTGNNAHIIPKKAVGYLMDNSTNLNSWNNKYYSQTKAFSTPVKTGDSLLLFAYCYVSNDFNGKSISIYINGKNTGKVEQFYDNKNKNKWQKLEINTNITTNDTVSFYLFWNTNFKDNDSIKGHVIFAYPYFKFIDKNDTYTLNSEHSLSSLSINKIQHLGKNSNTNNYINASFLALPQISSYQNNFNSIRTIVNSIVKEDTCYYGLKSDITISNRNKYGTNSRFSRWHFALQIFQKEYNWRKKIIGGGFDYLNWYGYYFYNDKTRADWPHNPFLSVLLYSGILGLLVYLYFLYKVFYLYIKYRKHYGIFFIFFLITFFFSFFSANSPFSSPIMGFFVLLPFFIDYIHKKEENLKLNKPESLND